MSKEIKDSWNKSHKESQKREDELVTLTAAAKENQEQRAERKGKVLKSFEVWVRSREKSALCKEEGRRAEDAALEARETFEKNFAKMLEKDDVLEEETTMIADKMWQVSQSDAGGLNLSAYLDDLEAAMETMGGKSPWTAVR